MMKICLVILSICISELVLAQKTNKMDNIIRSVSAYTHDRLKLSSDKLEKATMITYHCGNGTVAPEYHYDCYTIVTKNNVNVKNTQGYNGDVKYNESIAISTPEYKQFLNNLLKQDIRKIPSNGNEYLCGAGASDITIKMKQQVLFSGDEDVNLSITKGGLIDSFVLLLSGDMLGAVKNPDSKLNQLEIDPEIDIEIP